MTTYEPGFREEAIKLASEVGATNASKDLGVPINTLYTWIKKSRQHGEGRSASNGSRRTNKADDETLRYQKRIKELERANEILKEALSFFVVSQKK